MIATNKSCLGPYTIECSSLTLNGDHFVDSTKTQKIAAIGSVDDNSLPCSTATLLHQEVYDTCKIRWFECPALLGRKYTIIVSGCDVTITPFEPLGTINDCNPIQFGSETFCFGRLYDKNQETTSSDQCFTSFEFDGHRFSVRGHQSYDFGLYDCSNCANEEVSMFGGDFSTLGQSQPTPIPEEDPNSDDSATSEDSDNQNSDSGTQNFDDSEQRTVWHNSPDGDEYTGEDTFCSPEQVIDKDRCLSHNNPSVSILQSGQSVVAYENRDETGQTKISISAFKTSVGNSVKYYRHLSKGRIKNDNSSTGEFDIFDDVMLDSDLDTVPDESILIGFLTGPLKGGQPLAVTKVERIIDEYGSRDRTKISFSLGSIVPQFDDSNNKYDVEWFIIKTVDTLPISTIDLTHGETNNLSQVANPSIAVAKNNLGLTSDQHIFVTYQAYEDGKWNIYLRHISLGINGFVAPSYKLPYDFQAPVSSQQLVIQNFINVEYRVVSVDSVAGKYCALMSAHSPTTGEHFNSGLPVNTGTTTSCNQEYQEHKVYIEVTFNTLTCGLGVPSWSAGDVFSGTILPSSEQVGWDGDSSCISIVAYPSDLSAWTFSSIQCKQTNLIDDPYCPLPYLTANYKPEDLYTITSGTDILTRVLYHLEVNVPVNDIQKSADAIDFMFVIDHSGSMSVPISSVRRSVSRFTQGLRELGADFRFGLTVYARGIGGGIGPNGGPPVNPLSCCAFSATFDGLDYPLSDAESGFTRNVQTLDKAMSETGWNTFGGAAGHFSAVQFALNDTRFTWRSTAKRFIFLVTDASPNECGSTANPAACNGFTNSIDDAITACQNVDCTVISAVKSTFISAFLPLSEQTGWTKGLFPVGGSIGPDGEPSYDEALDSILTEFRNEFVVGLTILERNDPGFSSTFLTKAKVLITYDANLIDLWTQEKHKLKFTDNILSNIGDTKGLMEFPYTLYPGKIYGIDPVQPIGNMSNWVYFDQSGQLKLDYPNVGSPIIGTSEPVLLAENAIRPTVKVNNRNHVFVAFESLSNGFSGIEIRGTGDFAQDSITGPKGDRIVKLVSEDDFIFSSSVTLSGEGVNQLCDMVIDQNDVIHLTWQSNRDKYWEIYYANGLDLFEPVRITKAKSRSGFPKIDIDRNGTVFIVYHDNRYGPFNIMLSYKDRKRVVPLLQQDPYLASLSENYKHYTNLLPIIVSNPPIQSPTPGSLVASKVAFNSGNENENAVFIIENGLISGGGDTSPWSIVAMAGSLDGNLYGISKDDAYGTYNLLLVSGANLEDPYITVDPNEISSIGEITISDTEIVDMAHDFQGRLWILAIDNNGSPGSVRIINIDKTNADIITETTILDSSEEFKGGLACKSNGEFWWTFYADGSAHLSVSQYPTIFGSLASFDFQTLTTQVLQDNTPIYPSALTVDHDDNLIAIDNLDVYGISEDGLTSFMFSVESMGGIEDPYLGVFPIGSISGFAYKFSGQTTNIGADEYFNILLEFFDNINLVGEPAVSIDSRFNLDAFLSPQEIDDPYLPEDAYFLSAKGVFLTSGQSRVVIFDASLSRPETEQLAYPFGFDKNQTYFVKAYLISESNEITEIKDVQTYSFSCNLCSILNNSDPDQHACSLSFVIHNNSDQDRYFNFRVDLFADSSKNSITRRFNLVYGNADLNFSEVNNLPSADVWSQSGIKIPADDKYLVQIYPPFDSFVCGVSYPVTIASCSNSGEFSCSDFENIDNSIVFLCECASTVVPNPINDVRNVASWKSSGNGYSDTSITDDLVDNLRPSVSTRSTDGAIIVFEKSGKVYGSTFYKSDPNDMFGSGSKSGFNYDFNISGINTQNAVDFFDRNVLAYEKTSANEAAQIPESSIGNKVCDITLVPNISSSVPDACGLKQLELSLKDHDRRISEDVVRKIFITPEYVDYFTYNTNGQAMAVVSQCELELQIVATPEIVAVRLKNENQSGFGDWCAVSPSINRYTFEKNWTISNGSGIKEICAQFMSYNGITTQTCVPIIADYKRNLFELNIYENSDFTKKFPTFDGMAAISTKLNTTTGKPNENIAIYIEIIPNKEISDNQLSFDILQQGSDDKINIPANRTTNTAGKSVFRGQTEVKLDDQVRNKDGLAVLRVNIPSECSGVFSVAEAEFIKDEFNILFRNNEESDTDMLADFRQETVGRIGVNMVIRPTEDPYLIFGDPNYYLKGL